MAIARRAVGTVVEDTNISAGGTITFQKPAGTVSGDLLLAVYLGGDPGTGNLARAGWAQQVWSASGGACIALSFIAGGAEPTSYAFTNNSGSLVTCGVGFIVGYSGVDNTTPMDVTATTGSFSNTFSHLAPSITTVTNGAMLVGLVMTASAVTYSTIDMNMIATNAAAGTAWSGASGDLLLPTAGASGTTTFTASLKSAGPGAMLALRPAGGAAAVIPDLTMAPLGRAS